MGGCERWKASGWLVDGWLLAWLDNALKNSVKIFFITFNQMVERKKEERMGAKQKEKIRKLNVLNKLWKFLNCPQGPAKHKHKQQEVGKNINMNIFA